MKYLLAFIVTTMSILLFSEQAYAQVGETTIGTNLPDYTYDIDDSQLLAINTQSNGTIEVLVKASETVDYLCDQFNDSWLDVILTFYCAGGGDPYVCTAYKIGKVACGLNGAVKLVIEGDYDGALRRVLKTSASLVFTMVKKGDNSYALYAPNANGSR